MIAVCAAALLSCGDRGKTAKSPSPDPDPGAAVSDASPTGNSSAGPHEARDELYARLTEDLADANCDSYAEIVSSWVRDNEARIRQLGTQISDTEAIDEHLVAAFEVVMEGAADCVDSDSAQSAFDAFDELFIDG
jgi:hypothetical protein